MKPSRKASKAGSIEEVIIFSSTIGAAEKEARWFWHHFEGQDWENAGRPIKNWKAVFTAWWIAGFFPSQKSSKTNLPSAVEVRRVIREHRDRMVGLREADAEAAWERIFRSELQCSYAEAMRVLQ